ncbi:MAG: hypothetical protein KC620_03100, partial [Myxococcales bacterium]|nr:hypothetical protein [Myxococcales bacterium]
PGGGRFADAAALAARIAETWDEVADAGHGQPYVVFTGGEPALQLDEAVLDAVHARGFAAAIETNGTKPLPAGLDWICVSPKPRSTLVVTAGDELKLVFPQVECPPETYAALAFTHHFLQPMDGPDRAANTAAAAQYCLKHPRWRLSLQTHKLIGLP